MDNTKKTGELSLKKIFVILVLLVLVIAAVVLIFAFKFPAKRYVKSALNAICYDESKDYMKYTNTSKEEVDEAVNEDLNLQAEAYAAYFGVENLSDASVELLREFAKDVYSYSKFKVTKSKKTKDGYTVTVKVTPLKFSDFANKNVKKYIKEFNKKAEDGEFLYDSDAIYEEEFLKGLVEVYRSEFENIEYGSAKKITVKIKETADKRYSADLTDVLNALVEFE